MSSLPVPRRRNKGHPVDTIKALRTVHYALRLAYATGDEELTDCAESVLSALTLGIREPRQYVPDTVGALIELLNERIGANHDK